jgi:DNA-binding NarL/FixJ family response regulator
MSGPRSCLAGNRLASLPLLTASLATLGFAFPVVTDAINVRELGRSALDLLVVDLDDLDTDPIELLRMTRFVLPTCIIAVYSGPRPLTWARSCHLAGASCILSKSSGESEITGGLRQALASGCFTDPRFLPA